MNIGIVIIVLIGDSSFMKLKNMEVVGTLKLVIWEVCHKKYKIYLEIIILVIKIRFWILIYK